MDLDDDAPATQDASLADTVVVVSDDEDDVSELAATEIEDDVVPQKAEASTQTVVGLIHGYRLFMYPRPNWTQYVSRHELLSARVIRREARRGGCEDRIGGCVEKTRSVHKICKLEKILQVPLLYSSLQVSCKRSRTPMMM